MAWIIGKTRWCLLSTVSITEYYFARDFDSNKHLHRIVEPICLMKKLHPANRGRYGFYITDRKIIKRPASALVERRGCSSYDNLVNWRKHDKYKKNVQRFWYRWKLFGKLKVGKLWYAARKRIKTAVPSCHGMMIINT